MINILFWNINNKDICDKISEFANNYSIDILVLIEDENPASKMLAALNKDTNRYYFCNKNDRKISIYTSFDKVLFETIETQSKFISLVKFNFLKKEILFGGVHFPSKLMGRSDSANSYTIREIKKEIHRIETGLGHTQTLLVGDFNMNPFEEAMVESDAFNASMCREIANTSYRKVSGIGMGESIDYLYFYNPMWSFFGDLSRCPPGTYYYYGNQIDNHYRWNMFDQILIRPSLIPNFVEDSLEIIERDLRGNLLINPKTKTRGVNQISDHLPVVFSMNLNK